MSEGMNSRLELAKQAIPAIAKALGGTVVESESGCDNRKIDLSHLKPGAAVWVLPMWGQGGKAEISGEYPMCNGSRIISRDLVSYKEATGDRIGINLARTPDAIAKDISRRLLPRYFELLDKANARVSEREAHKATVAKNAQFIADALGGEVRGDDKNYRARVDISSLTHGCYGEFEIYGDSVEIKIRSLDVASAVKIAALIKTLEKVE